MINFPNEKFVNENTVILDQNSILNAFYYNIPSFKRNLHKISARKPRQSSYKNIKRINQKDNQQPHSIILPQVQVISSSGNLTEQTSFFDLLRLISTHQNDQRILSCEQSQSFLLAQPCYENGQQKVEAQYYKITENTYADNDLSDVRETKKHFLSTVNCLKNAAQPNNKGFEQQTKCKQEEFIQNECPKIRKKCKIEAKWEQKLESQTSSILENQRNKELMLSGQYQNSKQYKNYDNNNQPTTVAINNKRKLDYFNQIKQEQELFSQVKKNEEEPVFTDFSRMLIKLEDGRILEQIVEKKQNYHESSCFWDNKELIYNIQQAKQSLNGFLLNNKPKTNSLSQHLQTLNECILLTSSTSVGFQIDKFLSTLNQSSAFFLPTESSPIVHEKEISKQVQIKEQKESSTYFPEAENLIFQKSDAIHEQQSYRKTCIDEGVISIESSCFQSKNINENQSEAQKFCSSLFKFQIKDLSLLKQFKFSKQKKSLAVQNDKSEEEECMGSDKDTQQSIALEQKESLEISKNQNQQFLIESSKNSSKIKKYGKYHNFNKLFMYNVLSMFTTSSLYNFGVPENILNILQFVIQRLKVSAKKYSNINQKLPFNYFSHSHYNVLFLQLSQENIKELKQSEEIIQLYKYCFNINLQEEVSPLQLSYINLIKGYFYKIFMKCINIEGIQKEKDEFQDSRDLYTIKVVKGIRKLAQGLLIKRF